MYENIFAPISTYRNGDKDYLRLDLRGLRETATNKQHHKLEMAAAPISQNGTTTTYYFSITKTTGEYEDVQEFHLEGIVVNDFIQIEGWFPFQIEPDPSLTEPIPKGKVIIKFETGDDGQYP